MRSKTHICIYTHKHYTLLACTLRRSLSHPFIPFLYFYRSISCSAHLRNASQVLDIFFILRVTHLSAGGWVTSMQSCNQSLHGMWYCLTVWTSSATPTPLYAELSESRSVPAYRIPGTCLALSPSRIPGPIPRLSPATPPSPRPHRISFFYMYSL